MISIELLAPARDLPTAREAILHGADAVYIGADHFGARANASNSIEDIATLCHEAHIFGVRVYVTLNTIIKDSELDDIQILIWKLWHAGVDALIIQDMALLKMPLPPIELHASTQMDNRSADKVAWLNDLGFKQIVLARELTLSQIAAIHRAVPDVKLEVFVHGSICVCYNGQCYASQHLYSRSANRGECAQFCRMAFDLEDADGQVLQHQRYLLSMRDMNRSQELEQLLDAGARSLKIEGRLKDIPYVKNVVGYYRQLLDTLMQRRKEYVRSSRGQHTFNFQPRLETTFNRGFTNYFLNGRTSDLCNPITPKSMGEAVGIVKEIRYCCVIVSGTAVFNNGDGLCFVDATNRLQGFRVNRAEGNHLYLRQIPQALKRGMHLYRNQNVAFETAMSRPTATRRLPLRWQLEECNTGFLLRAVVEGYPPLCRTFVYKKEQANTPQRENIIRQLSRLGDTPYVCLDVKISFSREWFLPASVLSDWRKQLIATLYEVQQERSETKQRACKALRHILTPKPRTSPSTSKLGLHYIPQHLSYRANIANHLALQFYMEQGAKQIDMTMEIEAQAAGENPMLMNCKYCILSQLGYCLKKHSPSWHMPLFLRLADGRRFRLGFDCKKCEMYVYASD